MKTPFEFLEPSLQCWVLVALAVAAAVTGFLMTRTPLDGIISYELAWTRENAQNSLDAWEKEGKLTVAKDQTRLDFLFILFLYPGLSLACAMISDSTTDWSNFGIFLSWAVLFAGLCDVVENIFLLQMLASGASSLSAGVAGFFSSVKWTIGITGALYVVIFGIPLLLSAVICWLLNWWFARQ